MANQGGFGTGKEFSKKPPLFGQDGARFRRSRNSGNLDSRMMFDAAGQMKPEDYHPRRSNSGPGLRVRPKQFSPPNRIGSHAMRLEAWVSLASSSENLVAPVARQSAHRLALKLVFKIV